MALRLTAAADDFSARFDALLSTKREVSEDVDQAVATILADVKARGDAALIDLSLRFDRVDLEAVGIRVAPDEIAAARAA
ncbi:histidinol dehydrogenase, partial [Hansschlegelia beijingensis]